MKHLFFSFLLFSTTIVCQAQVQNGVVKTNGRPNKPGVPLGNVAVKASGFNVSLSSEDGTFDIAMNGIKSGESFFLTSVTKNGYELCDRNAIGRKYGYSASVPLVITMVSKAELEEEKQRIRNNAIEATQEKYKNRIEELERQLEEHSITEDSFSQQLQELQKMFDRYNDLVEDLADKYARTDYDKIDSIDRAINEAIEKGLFDVADSLIHSKGNINERHQKIMEWNASSKRQKASIDKQLSQWETSESLRIKELDNLVGDYYHSFSIEVSRMQPEKAVSWLEKRLELDPECFEWLIEVGKFYKVYLGKNGDAMKFFDRAYKIANKTKQTLQYIEVLIEQGGVYMNLYKFEDAERCYKEALHYAEKDQNFQATASIYNNLGFLTKNKSGDMSEAKKYYEKSLDIASDSLWQVTSSAYVNLSVLYADNNNYDLAYSYLDKAIEIAEQNKDKRTLSICYSNKGVYYNELGKDKEALELYEKALAVQKEIYPSTHPSIANTLCNISTTYYNMSRLAESMDYLTKAIAIYQQAYGEKHPDVAGCYKEMAKILLDAGLFEKALTFTKKSWEINSIFFSETSSPEYASICNLLGQIYDGMEQDSLSLNYYQNALKIYDATGMSKTSDYASICNNISIILFQQNKYEEAIEYIKQSLDLFFSIKGRENNSYINTMNNLAYIYEGSGQKEQALNTYKEVEDIIIKTFGKWHKSLSINYNNVGHIYLKAKEYDKSRDYFFKSLEICDSIYKRQPNELSMSVLSNIAMTYYNEGKWKETIPWIEKAAPMRSQLITDYNRRYSYYYYIYDCYSKLSKSGNAEDIRNLKNCQDTLWVGMSIVPDGLAAQKYGLDGYYIVLRYGDWEQGGTMSFIEEYTRMKTVAPKDILVYKEGIIDEIHFEENTIGINCQILPIDKSTSQEIKERYANWKVNVEKQKNK